VSTRMCHRSLSADCRESTLGASRAESRSDAVYYKSTRRRRRRRAHLTGEIEIGLKRKPFTTTARSPRCQNAPTDRPAVDEQRRNSEREEEQGAVDYFYEPVAQLKHETSSITPVNLLSARRLPGTTHYLLHQSFRCRAPR